MLTIGTYRDEYLPPTFPVLECLDDDYRHLLSTPWMYDYIAERLGVAPFEEVPTDNEPVELEDWICERPQAVIGKSGGGKTKFAEALAAESVRAGCSLMMILPKPESFSAILSNLQAGIDPIDVHILDPTAPSTPAWNYNLEDLPPYQIASDFVTVVETAVSGPAPRLKDLAANAATIIAAHRLSIVELIRILIDDTYRTRLLTMPCAASTSAAYTEACRYFTTEFANWGKSERASAIAPLLNKIRELVRSDYLLRLLTARRNTLDLASLFQRRQIVCVSLDRAVLGDQAAKMLGALLIHGIYRAALRRPGPVPVSLVLDEVPILEAFLGDVLLDILRTGRSLGLRSLFIMQELNAVSASLRAALIGNVSLLAAFAVGADDARLLANAIAHEPLPRLKRAEVAFDECHGLDGCPLTGLVYPLVDHRGKGLTLKSPALHALEVVQPEGLEALTWLLRLARHAGLQNLYVARAGDLIDLPRFLAGLAPEDFAFSGPPLAVTVWFPRPRLYAVERSSQSDAVNHWSHTLQNLPVQTCAIKLTGEPPAVIRVRDVRTASSSDRLASYTAAARAANTQSSEECAAALRWREAEIARVTRGFAKGEADDGSLA